MSDKIFSAHQLSFFPWIGFWRKIYQSDFFDLSIYDQFTKNTWIHFSYIGNNEKRIRWSLPIEKDFIIHSSKYCIKDVLVKEDFASKMLEQFYKVHHNDRYFEYAFPLLKEWLFSVEKLKKLWLINFVLINKVYEYLQLNTALAIMPYMNNNDSISGKIAAQTQALGCQMYLSGPHGVDYLDIAEFNKKGIKVVFQDTAELYKKYPESIISLLSEYGVNYVIELLKA